MISQETLITVRDLIHQHPGNHHQRWWIELKEYPPNYWNRPVDEIFDFNCGGSLCVCGFIAYVEGKTIRQVRNAYPELDKLFFADEIGTKDVLGCLDQLIAGDDPWEVAHEAKQLSGINHGDYESDGDYGDYGDEE